MAKMPRPDANIDNPVYGVPVVVFFSRKRFEKYMDYICQPESTDGKDGRCVMVYSPQTAVVAVGVFNDSITTLAHELIHAATFILERAGISISDSCAETLCYMHSYLMHNALLNDSIKGK